MFQAHHRETEDRLKVPQLKPLNPKSHFEEIIDGIKTLKRKNRVQEGVIKMNRAAVMEFVAGEPSLSTLDSENEQRLDRISLLLEDQKRKLQRANTLQKQFDSILDDANVDPITPICARCQQTKDLKSEEEKSWEKEKKDLQRKQADLLN